MRDPRERLRDILEAIGKIERYLDRGRSAFEQDELLFVWLVHNLQIIGEAARTLPQSVRDQASAVPWSKVIGMRNILVHDYMGIEFAAVWNAVDDHLPLLKPEIEALLRRLED